MRLRKRNKISLSHFKLLTTDMFKLVPLTWLDVLPGDTFQHSTSVLLRCSPLLAPVMHPVRVRIHHWYVPLRIIWDDFEDFITGGADGTDSTTPPYKNYNSDQSSAESTLADYLGIPPIDYTGKSMNFSILPFRVYTLIFNEFYRDQDLVTELGLATGNGSDSTTNRDLQSVAWEKDYFTTCRPWETKGDDVYIPLTEEVIAVEGDGTAPEFSLDSVGDITLDRSGGTSDAIWSAGTSAVTAFWDDPSLQVDIGDVAGVSIQDLATALGIYRFQEARARWGSRYSEYLRSLGVRSRDGRLDRPEYLGGGSQTIQFSEVLATDGSNTGDMYGHGIGAMRTNRYRRFFDEHGIVMTLMSVVPKAIYGDGVHRSWWKTTKEEFYQHQLENVGDQVITNKELYVDHTTPDGTFGYQRRYDEYRFHPSSIAGEFRSTLDHWHLARLLGSDPALNSSFITGTDSKRINASGSTDSLYIMANHSIQARRMLSRRPQATRF